MVVTEEIAHPGVAVDDLLGASDRERSHLREVLHRRTVAVDRRVVEVRAELVHRVLRLGAHERLTAESDDRLFRGAMPVVLEALAVVADELLVVLGRPEDVVRKEAVTVVRGLLGDLRTADAAVPDEGSDPVERARRRGEALQRSAEVATPVDDVLAPQSVQQRVVLDGERDALPDVLTEPRVHRAGVAAAEHHVHPSAGEVLEHRVVLGELDRVVGGDVSDAGGELQRRGLRREVGQQRGRRRVPEPQVVMLADREDVEPDLFGMERDGQRVLDLLGLAQRAAGRGVFCDVAHGKDPELHGGHLGHSFSCVVLATVHAFASICRKTTSRHPVFPPPPRRFIARAPPLRAADATNRRARLAPNW